MASSYTENPSNFDRISPFVKIDIDDIKKAFFSASRILFYDACSFQRHSRVENKEQSILINYYKGCKAAVFITRCVLMELASEKHILPEEYVYFIQHLSEAGVNVIIYDEEHTHDILSECFSTNEKINEYLVWAVRAVKSPVSTIEETLKRDAKLKAAVIEAKDIKSSTLYHRFFSAVRGNKEDDDNLGEELISISVHILSYLPGLIDGKLCVLTDDKGAAGKIYAIRRRTNPHYRGSKVLLLSTPKLVQHMFLEHVEISEEEMINIVEQGISGNITVMGITPFDLDVVKLSMTSEELVHKIMDPNGIKIVF